MADVVARAILELASDDAAVRLAAAERLGRMGEEARAAAVPLVKCLPGDEALREAAVGALEGLGPPLAEQLPELLQLLADRSGDVAYWSATLIGRLRPADETVTVALARVVDGPAELAARERAAWALGEIGPAARGAVESLQKAVASGAPRLARLAAEALATIRGQ